jgi:hypothetical protein
MKESIFKYFGQIFLIVFSVVLGLFLSERIEENKRKKEASQLLSKLKLELNENKKILDYWVPYHREIVEKLDSLSEDEKFIKTFISDKSAIFDAFSQGTIMSDMPSNDAWDIAKSHPLVVNIDYDILLNLSRVYNQQKFTYESIPKLIDLMMSTEFNAKETAKSNLQLFRDKLGEVYGREKQLINYYNQAEKKIKFQTKKD